MYFQIYFAFMTVFSILAFLLNGFTMIAIVAIRSLRKIPHIFTFNIALADFLSACSLIISQWLQYWVNIDVSIMSINANVILKFCYYLSSLFQVKIQLYQIKLLLRKLVKMMG